MKVEFILLKFFKDINEIFRLFIYILCVFVCFLKCREGYFVLYWFLNKMKDRNKIE